MWLYVPEARPQICKEDITLLSIHSGGGMLDEGIKAGLEHSTGRRTIGVGYCERQAGAAATLVARMEDAGLDSAPIWDDSESLPCELWRDRVAVVTAGIPCQPWSGAGARLGVRDPRWLWPHLARIIREVRPSLLILENVAGFLTPHDLDRDGFAGWSLPAGLGVILGELAEMGWDAEWVCLPAAAVGAHHLRWRVFVGATPSDGKHAHRTRLGRTHQKARTRRRATHSAGTARPDTKGISRRLHLQQRRPAETGRNPIRNGQKGADSQSKRCGQTKCRRQGDKRSDSRNAPRPNSQCDGRGQGSEEIRARESESPRCGGGPGAEAGRLPQLPFFALPPQECWAWATVPAWLEPAVEPGFCVSLHGVAVVVDEARVTQLRTSGNGVVALQAAVATVALVERLGITQGHS